MSARSKPVVATAAMRIDTASEAESALRAVRIVLGLLAAFVVIGYRPIVTRQTWSSIGGTIAAIIVCVALLNVVSKSLQRTRLRLAIGQMWDILATVGLASVLDGPLGQETWALLLVPIISGAVRLGAAASLLTWLAGCVFYQAAAWAGLVTGLDAAGLLIRAPGTLLAIAITVGLLARWMREGWEVQNELTNQATDREHRLAVIEATSRGLDQLTVDDALELCLTQTLALGFDAATLYGQGQTKPKLAVGHSEIAAASGSEVVEPGSIIITSWTDRGSISVSSATVFEPQTRSTIVGWSTAPIATEMAQALGTLASHTAMAIGSTIIRLRLEEAASRDPLTSLANRRTFDAELERCARGPGAIALAFIDVNDFKSLNDQHGHLVGDQLLIAISRRVEGAVGDNGMVARFGGDEFVVLFPDTSIETAQQFAGHIADAMQQPVGVGGESIKIALSVGVSGGMTPVSPLDLIRAGDQAAYQAKSAFKHAQATMRRESSGDDAGTAQSQPESTLTGSSQSPR